MQAVPKKPNFKCPKFSVPAKPQSEKSDSTEKQEKKKVKKEKLTIKKHLPEHVGSDGSTEVSPKEQIIKPVNQSGDKPVNQSGDKPINQSGDNTIQNAQPKDISNKTEPIKESGDNVNTNLSEEQTVEDKEDGQEEVDHVKPKQDSTSVTDKKVVEKKNKTTFSVKAAIDNQQTDAGSKKNIKEKKIKENKSEVQKQKKEKVKKQPEEKKEPKVPKEKKDLKTKEPRKTLPVRSLTDEEYTAIFDAAVENALNLNMDIWAPKATSPVKKKEPVKKRYSVTVGKKAKEAEKSTQESCTRPSESKAEDSEDNDKEHEVLIGLDNSEMCEDVAEEEHVEVVEKPKTEDIDGKKENSDKKEEANNYRNEGSCNEEAGNSHENGQADDEKETVSDDEKGEKCDDERELVDMNNNDVQENGEDDDDDEDEEEEIVVDEVEEEPAPERTQDVNETTPVGSEADLEERHSKCIITPIKKKKILKVNKNPKLEPKQLPFEKPKEVSMVDKVKQLKKQKQEKQEVPTKNRKLYNDIKRHGTEKEGTMEVSSLEKDGKRKKPTEKKISKKQKLQEREVEINGTWVQCCNSTCMKWRYLSDISDPTLIPERWTCNMNTNKKYNSCEKAEEVYDESEHIYTKFTEGSVVWAKMTGFPWWPAMVEIDPDTETFFSIDTDDAMIPTHYHVVFFDDHVSRTWVKADYVKMFTGNEEEDGILHQIPKKGNSYKKEIAVAKKNAMRARSCTIQERIELFGFAARYKGPWTSKSKGKKTDKSKGSKVKTEQKNKDEQVTILDDDTMDDVIENTEALLDNVEEMLESINSQLDDSDADSDFMPEELVVVETKNKKGRKSLMSSPNKIDNPSNKKVNFSEADTEIDEDCSEDSTKCDKEEKNTEENSEIKGNIDDTIIKTVEKGLKLDSDIFTMEMMSQDDNVSDMDVNDNENVKADLEKEMAEETSDEKMAIENEVSTTLSKTKGRSSKREKENNSDTPSKTKGKSSKRKKEHNDNLDNNQVKVKAKKQKENKVEKFDTIHKVTNTVETSDKQNKCYKQEHIENDLPKNENSPKVTENEISDKSTDTVKNSDDAITDKCLQDENESCSSEDKPDVSETDKIGDEVENISQEEQDSELEAIEVVEDDKNPQNNVESSPKTMSDNQVELQKVDESDDELDLDAIENDAVPDVDREETNAEETNTGTGRSLEQSLDDNSDGDFDLEEHFMYETVTDGADKVRERGVVNVPAHIEEVDEDSDPFDLMEE